MKGAVGLLVVALLTGVVAGTALPAPGRTVPCREIIDSTMFPYLGGYEASLRYRLVLGQVSVPPAYMEQVVPLRSEPRTRWRYWRKQGLVLRANGKPVTITVPKAWRERVAIAWGNAGHGPFASLRIAGCGSNPRAGNAYAGGFFLRSRAACIPLIFRVGTRSATVRFGLGKPCD